jgi:hypothetical protein
MRILVVLVALVIGHGVAEACQCSRTSLQSALRAKSVFVGRVDAVQVNGQTITYTLAVDGVYKGTAKQTMTVSGSLDDCGHSSPWDAGDRLMIVGGTIAMCNGSGPVSAETIKALDKALGKARKPKK